MSSSATGLMCLLFFAVSQGVRDAMFGNIFQSVSFFFVAILAFGTSTVCFSGLALLCQPDSFRKLPASPAMFTALNVTTAAAWLSFFFGLKHLEPAVVATLFNGIGPLTVIILARLGWMKAMHRLSAGEALCYVGVAAMLAALTFVVLTNRSGLSISDLPRQGAALLIVAAGGVTITISHMIARWFNDRGVGSYAVMGTRFLLTLFAAAAIELAIGQMTTQPPLGAVPVLALTAFALITIPSFSLQLGIARASPLAVNVMRSLGPVSVFAVQQFDGRLRFSSATLICIIGFCIFAIGASVLRAWSEVSAHADSPIETSLMQPSASVCLDRDGGMRQHADKTPRRAGGPP
jgi:drug/metabolite transporter (DMT)-like permease